MQCIEMESGAVGQVCYLLKVPFIVIRSISDFVFENENFQTHNDNVESSTTNSALVFLSLRIAFNLAINSDLYSGITFLLKYIGFPVTFVQYPS